MVGPSRCGRRSIWNAGMPAPFISIAALAASARRPGAMWRLAIQTKASSLPSGSTKRAVANLAWFATGPARLTSNSTQIRCELSPLCSSTSPRGSKPRRRAASRPTSGCSGRPVQPGGRAAAEAVLDVPGQQAAHAVGIAGERQRLYVDRLEQAHVARKAAHLPVGDDQRRLAGTFKHGEVRCRAGGLPGTAKDGNAKRPARLRVTPAARASAAEAQR